jgi:hypothetical protein
MNYMKYASSLNILHEDVMMKILVSSLESSQKDCLAHSCNLKSIPSSTKIIEEFPWNYRPTTQSLQDAFQEIKHTLCREGFLIDDETIDEEVLDRHICEENYQAHLEEVSHVEYLDETFDEDIQAFVPPTHQQENMLSCNPFENLDVTLFHTFGSKQALEEILDATYLFKKGKQSTLH